MLRGNVNDLVAFLAVARERSFTRAAAKLGISQSALSQTIRNLEERLDVRLLNRTTRRVTPTEAGERIGAAIAPHFQEIEAELLALRELRTTPAGAFRITANDHAASTLLVPRLSRFLPAHPAIEVEVVVDNAFTDIITQRFDAGVRSGERVDKDMIAVRIGPDMRMAVVGAPSCFDGRPLPKKPQDLTEHACINLRLPTYGGLYAWEFEKKGRVIHVRVDGQLVLNGTAEMLQAALAGAGLAYVPEDVAGPYLKQGSLRRVLEDWCPAFPGYHLYYPNRRRSSRAFALVVDALRLRP